MKPTRMTCLSITLSAPLLARLVRTAQRLHGRRGVSKYLREVITDALGK